jgi:tryprostatin B 6-hydroxylase
VNVVDVMSWFAFDAMGDVLFGRDFGMIEAREYHPAVPHQKLALALMGPILNTVWIPRLAFTFLPFLGKVKDWMYMVNFCNACMDERMKANSTKTDLAAMFIDEYERLKTKETLKKRQQILEGSTLSAVVAGRYVELHPEPLGVYSRMLVIPPEHHSSPSSGSCPSTPTTPREYMQNFKLSMSTMPMP